MIDISRLGVISHSINGLQNGFVDIGKDHGLQWSNQKLTGMPILNDPKPLTAAFTANINYSNRVICCYSAHMHVESEPCFSLSDLTRIVIVIENR
jgi:hypothetical protein